MRPVHELRADTPGCAYVAHFNNAGCSLPPSPVIERTIDHLTLEATIGGYEAAELAREELETTYDALAAVVGAHGDEIAIADSATRAWLAAFTAVRLGPGDRILTTKTEYSSNIIAMRAAAEMASARIDVIPSDPSTGELSLEHLANMMDDDVRLIAVTHAPTNGGLLQPIRAVGQIAQASSAVFLVDACQSIGQLPIDVGEFGIDILAATGRKYLRAPRGTGFLFVRRGLIEELRPVHLDLHSATVVGDTYQLRSDARRFELWEKNIAAVLGLKRAAEYYVEIGIEEAWDRVASLGDELRNGLTSLRNVTVLDLGTRKSGIVSFQIDGCEPGEVVETLRKEHVNVSRSCWSSTPWDMEERGLDCIVRASVHYYNDEADMQTLLEALDTISG